MGGKVNGTTPHQRNESTCIPCNKAIKITHQTVLQNNNNLFEATKIVPNLDYNKEAAIADGRDDNLCDDGDGIQQSFNEAITNRLQLEISRHTKYTTEQ